MFECLKPYSKTRRHIVGVSGGCDSVVLLRALHQLGHRKLIVAHVNHRLRGRASGADATFVRRLAKSLDLECEVESYDVRQLAAVSKLSIEHAARNARYAFFAKLAKQHRCPRILLGHHANDQVETVLMNFFRGTGIAGLSGMDTESERCIDGKRLIIIRPLLHLWREDLEAAAQQQHWQYREDATNADSRFLRNRVRHEAIPYLSELFGRDIRTAVARLAAQSEAENDFIDALVREAADKEMLSVRELRQQPLALQRRLVHRWLKTRGVSDVSFDLVEQALTLIPESAIKAKINLPKGLHLRRQTGKMFIVSV